MNQCNLRLVILTVACHRRICKFETWSLHDDED